LAYGRQDRLSKPTQADQGGPDGKPGDEGPGTVNRVQNPDEFLLGTVLPVFLSDHAMLWKDLGEPLADSRLCAPVRHGDRIETGVSTLILEAMLRPEEGQDHVCGNPVEIEDQRVEDLEAFGREHVPI
jgi:hypothetical protein